MQFNYFQVMSINFKKLFVYSYCYPIFLYVYIIASKIIPFFTTVELMYFQLSGVKKICLNSQEFSNYSILGFLTSFYMKRTLVVKKFDAWYRISCVFIGRYIVGRWLYWKTCVGKFYKVPHEIWYFFPVAERLLIQLIIQRRIQIRVKYLKWSFLRK